MGLTNPLLLQQLRAETAQLSTATMQIAPEQGQMMHLLVKLMGAGKVLEIGTFTGYSTAWLALALPPQGRLIACDVSAEWTQIGQRYWQQLELESRIELRLAPALDTLTQLINEGYSEQFDVVFIDADKTNYLAYYETSLRLLRQGGLILIDNTLWSGSVIDPADTDPDTVAIREFNQHLARDPRITLSLLPIADGLTLALKNVE
jgi:caffeoyl-CoA O-methyltransferase